ncbi:hypothetical protein DFH11DRAFT_1723817 [Phellopilus nigrolimitatus]|nr:hypothetical protein DFH11DRAFT_1723817 [Phellopilus nigrolimitatus]
MGSGHSQPYAGSFDEDSRLLKTKKDYNRGELSRKLVLAGLATSFIFGVFCIVIGLHIKSQSLPVLVQSGTYHGGNLHVHLNPLYAREVLLLLLNVTFVKLSVWSSGSAHETALKWKLAFEKDRQTNGLTANVIMALCLAISYASSSMVLLSVASENENYNTVVSFVALIILGSVTVIEGVLERRPGRCMYSLYDRYLDDVPMKPRERQMPAWMSHPQFRRFVLYIWMSIGAGYYWCFIIWSMMVSGTQGSHYGTSWALIPWTTTNTASQAVSEDTGAMTFGWQGNAPTAGLIWGLGILVGFQGGIVTTALTCTQLLVALVRDEWLWREAGSEKGSDPSPGFFKIFFLSWQSIAIHTADPILHWLFVLAVSVNADIGLQARPVQWGAFIREISSQSTYRHLQTLVDLIDEWDEKMFWGHKRNGHAGTSRFRLGEVSLAMVYGGSGHNC